MLKLWQCCCGCGSSSSSSSVEFEVGVVARCRSPHVPGAEDKKTWTWGQQDEESRNSVALAIRASNMPLDVETISRDFQATLALRGSQPLMALALLLSLASLIEGS